MKALAFAIVIFSLAAAISWVIRSRTNAKIKLDRASVKNRIENDLLSRLDETRPSNFSLRNRDKHNQ